MAILFIIILGTLILCIGWKLYIKKIENTDKDNTTSVTAKIAYSNEPNRNKRIITEDILNEITKE